MRSLIVLMILVVLCSTPIPSAALAPCAPLPGTPIDAMETIGGWYMKLGPDDSPDPPTVSLSVVPGHNGSALQITYNLKAVKGNWVQIRRDFTNPQLLDLSGGDHLRFYHRGTAANTIEVGLVHNSPNPNYFASAWNEATYVPWWTYATWDLDDFRNSSDAPFPNLSEVSGIFISVANTAEGVGGQGSFIIDELQLVDAAGRDVPDGYEDIFSDDLVDASELFNARQKAAGFIANQQKPGGLLKSWQEETVDFSWLYDQALGLFVLSRTDSAKADLLVDKLHTLQNPDGSWFFGYHYLTDESIKAFENGVLIDKKDIGPVAWLVLALMDYRARSSDAQRQALALADAQEAAAWIATYQEQSGRISTITEWNLDAWFAFQATGYMNQANPLRDHLLNAVWDSDMGRFKSSAERNQIFLDNQTWGAAFLRAVGREEDARRALSYAQAMLATTSSDGTICGLDGGGPFGVWNEGVFQYIVEGGENRQFYLQEMLDQQATDGGMPNSRDSFNGYIIWLSPWHGIAPTAWLYFTDGGGQPRLPIVSGDLATPARSRFRTSTPRLTWNPVNWAQNYEVQLDSDTQFNPPFAYTDTISVPMWEATTTPLARGTYYWRVRALDDNNQPGQWSPAQRIEVDVP